MPGFSTDPILPSNQNPLGALPARFRRQRILVIGCGDVGLRTARALGAAQGAPRPRVLALTSSPDRVAALRTVGITPLVGDLDHAGALQRLAGIAHRVIHLAPPPGEGAAGAAWWMDARTVALARALRLRALPAAVVYASTSGVYGDCGGARVAETRPVAPATPRAQRRVNAERAIRHLGRAGTRASILRIPGIYAPDREGGTPEARLRRGTPVLVAEEDVYTNHIHADDLARIVLQALMRGRSGRVYHAVDDTRMKMADYFDAVADAFGMPRSPRLPRAELAQLVSPVLLSYMSESRQLDNTRLRRELRVRLQYPDVATALARLRG